MDPDGGSLADEAEAALRARVPVAPGAPAAPARVRSARRRFLPYVVVGGAVVGGYQNIVAAGPERLEIVFGVAVTAGIGAGMALGWPLLGRYERRAGRTGTGSLRLDLAIVLLTFPAYVAAVWVAALAGWATLRVVATAGPDPDPPNAWPLLIGAVVVLYPLSFAFARRDTGRPDDFVGAVTSMRNELDELPRTFGVVAEFLIALAWLAGTLVALFAVLRAIQLVFASQLAGLAVPDAAMLLLLVAWIGTSAVGTVWTVHRLDRRRAGRQRGG